MAGFLTLAFALGGTILGGVLGGQTGAQIGLVAGSIIGGLIEGQPNQEGPRLHDLKIPDSSYGVPIPILYGKKRLAGNMFWTSGIKEHKASAEGVTQYTYSASFAIGVCEGPIDSITKVWLDGTLIYDKTRGNYGPVTVTGATVDIHTNAVEGDIRAQATGVIDAKTLKEVLGRLFTGTMAFYLGTEDQLPDYVMVADRSYEETPAYRGLAYIRFHNWPLQDYGNRIPTATVEAVEKTARHYEKVVVDTTDTFGPGSGAQAMILDEENHRLYLSRLYGGSNRVFSIIDTVTNTEIESGFGLITGRIPSMPGFASTPFPFRDFRFYIPQLPFGPLHGLDFLFEHVSFEDTVGGMTYAIDAKGAVYTFVTNHPFNHAMVRLEPHAFARTHDAIYPTTNRLVSFDAPRSILAGRQYVWTLTGGFYDAPAIDVFTRPGSSVLPPSLAEQIATVGISALTPTSLALFNSLLASFGSTLEYNSLDHVGGGSLPGNTFSWCLVEDVLNEQVYVIASSNGGRTWLVGFDYRAEILSEEITDVVRGGTSIAYDPEHQELLLVGQGAAIWSIPQGRIVRSNPALNAGGTPTSWNRGVVNSSLWTQQGFGRFSRINTQSLSVEEYDGNIYGGAGTHYANNGSFSGGVYEAYSDAIWVIEQNHLVKYLLHRESIVNPTLGDIIEDISLRVGLSAGDIDVSTLTTEVQGYVLSRQATARTNIDPLLNAYFVDARESDWQLIYTVRGGTPVAVLTADDLAAHTPGNAPPDVLTSKRSQDVDIPYEVSVTFSSPRLDYQDGMQLARRTPPAMSSRNIRQESLPVVLSDEEARRIADRLLYEGWETRTAFSATVASRWSILDPGDIVQFSLASGDFTCLLTSVQHGHNGVIELQGVSFFSPVYSSDGGTTSDPFAGLAPAPGELGSPAPGPQEIEVLSPTELILLDIPLVTDQADNAGFYLGAAPSGGGAWNNADVYLQGVAGSWNSIALVRTEAVYGSALSVLQDGSPYVWDDGHRVVVKIVAGSLSDADDLDVLDHENLAVLGDEIISFGQATWIDERTYVLGHLLRGRYGTEWATSTHGLGDQFVMLNTVIRVGGSSQTLFVPMIYQGVTVGTHPNTAGALETFTNTGRSLKPYAPDHFRATRSVSNDVTFTWKRRARTHGEWLDALDVPLDEFTEAYEIDVFANDGVTVVRTLEATTQTASYSAAQQTADGLTPGDVITARLYQLSAVIGRGFAREAIL